MPRKALRFAGRMMVVLAVLLGPMAILIVAALLFGLSDQLAKGWFLVCMIWVMCGLVLSVEILFPTSGPSRGSPPDGGGGEDPPGPPLVPTDPRGGVPLPDAGPSRDRVRDHDRSRRSSWPRRSAREPEPLPGPARE